VLVRFDRHHCATLLMPFSEHEPMEFAENHIIILVTMFKLLFVEFRHQVLSGKIDCVIEDSHFSYE